MATNPANVIEAFNTAATPRDFKAAERAARRLAPHDQLLVVKALRAAEARLSHTAGGHS